MKNSKYVDLKEKKTHGDFDIFMDIYEGVSVSAKDNYLHWHDEMEIVYIHSGTGKIHVDLKEYYVKPNDLIFISPTSLHYMSSSSTEELKYEAIVFDLSMFLSSKLDSSSSIFIKSLINDKILYPIINSDNFKNYNLLLEYILKISSEFKSKDYSYQLKIKGYFFLLFSILFEDNIISNNKSSVINNEKLEKIKSVIMYIKNNYNNPIKIKDLAKISGYSEYYFIRFFKNQTGKTATNFINSIRIEKAINLLKSTNLSITDIGFETGFSDVSYFIKIFKSFTGSSPASYRKSV
ncbi:MAG: AraC family transcriptional regulator [Clostridium chrysemydis]|uniref:AraC family transcriptional regulator n=3 Tax=Clostridiaceae TaxID=31979 RepID=UPI0021520793|nr:AraC family transcriptional regulator [Clostridium sp. LY3-2]MCR6514855.1 AraC family transcriptional regulator [Clostridium sp. LY3-2]